jgi:hypothetical protein
MVGGFTQSCTGSDSNLLEAFVLRKKKGHALPPALLSSVPLSELIDVMTHSDSNSRFMIRESEECVGLMQLALQISRW